MRVNYESHATFYFAELLYRVELEDKLGRLMKGWWVANCHGPSHPEAPVEFYLNTRDVYYSRPRALACENCQPAVIAWIEEDKAAAREAAIQEGVPVTARRLAATRPPSPIYGLIFGRIQVDEWIPRIGWGCQCLCGCGGYEVVRNTQAVLQLAIRPCPLSGRVRPATGCTVTYRDGQQTEVTNATS